MRGPPAENPYRTSAEVAQGDRPPGGANRKTWWLAALVAAACPALYGGVIVLYLDLGALGQVVGAVSQLACGFGGAAAAAYVLWKGNLLQRILVLGPFCFLLYRGVPNATHVLLMILENLWRAFR